MRPLAATDEAITDLYDTKRGTFLVNIPVWLVVTLALTGVVAFAISGFLGYEIAGTQAAANDFFYRPLVLYLWFCALLITLQILIFRNKALRGRLITTLIFSVISIIVVYLIGFPQHFILKYLGELFPKLASAGVTYTIVNFGIIIVYFADSIWRWIRRARNLPINPVIDLRTGKEIREKVDPKTQPSMSELISGDLIAGAGIAALLALLFQPTVLSYFIHTIPPLSDCASIPVSLTTTNCVQSGGGLSLSRVDEIQALSYFIVGILWLALTAVLGGFGAVEGVPERAAPSSSLRQAAQAVGADEHGATAPIAENVAGTVLDTIRTALNRRLRLLLESLARSLRNIAWPALVFFATYGLYELAVNLQNYLHAPKALSMLGSLNPIVMYILPAVGWGVLSIIGVVLSSALAVFRWRVVDNTTRFLGLVGFIVLLTFWIFDLAMWGFNQLLLLTQATHHHPFDPPSVLAYISIVALLIFGSIFLIRGMRGPSQQTRASANQIGASFEQTTHGGARAAVPGASDQAETNKVPVVNVIDPHQGQREPGANAD